MKLGAFKSLRTALKTGGDVGGFLVEQLDDYIKDASGADTYIPSRTFHPSGMICPRVIYYQLKGVKPTDSQPSESMTRIGESGSDAHVRIQQWLTMMGESQTFKAKWMYCDVAQYIREHDLKDLDVVRKNGMEYLIYDKRYDMRFQTDGILYNRELKRYFVFEFKTESQMKWDRRTWVDEKHYNQGIAYSLAFGIDNVIFVYEGRDFLQHKGYCFHVTDAMREDLVRLMDLVKICVKRDILPPCLCKKYHIDKYSSYRSLCLNDRKGEVSDERQDKPHVDYA